MRFLPKSPWRSAGSWIVLALALLALASCGVAPRTPSPSNGPTGDALRALLSPPPPQLPQQHANIPLSPVQQQQVPVSPSLRTQAAISDKVELRLLVIAADDSDFVLPAWTQILNRIGTPYDVFVASRQTLTYDQLVRQDGVGKYDAILITNSQLVYSPDGGSSWVNAFDPDEWNALWQYERDYRVREVDFYTYPSTYPQDLCLQLAGSLDTTSAPLDATVTAAGRPIFTYLKDGAVIPIQNAWVYQASLAPGCDATPVLVDTAGNVLAATSTSADGRERLAVTIAQNPYYVYTQLLGYGLVEWATHGVYLGEVRYFLKADVDDWGLAGDERLADGTICTDDPTYPYGEKCPPYRISASDALAAADQQAALHAEYPLASAFKLDMAFNGEGLDPKAHESCDPNVGGADPLSSATRCLAKTFGWINHTYSHPYMESETFDGARQEIDKNAKVAKDMKLPITKDLLKTGDFSGLGYYYGPGSGTCPAWMLPPWGATYTDFGLLCSNGEFLRAARSRGIRYVESNNSIASHQAPCLSCGIRHPLQPDIMLVPDWPDNVHYWATTPQELVSSYNAFYGPGGSMPYFDHDLSYQEILAEETSIALYHLQTTAYPHFFHEENLRQYAPGHSLVFDWIGSVVAAYSSYYDTPLLTPSWSDLADYVADRTLHSEAVSGGASAVWDRTANKVTVTAPSVAPEPTPTMTGHWAVFVTGIRAGKVVTYGSDTISMLTLAPSQSISAAPVSTSTSVSPPPPPPPPGSTTPPPPPPPHGSAAASLSTRVGPAS